jgi:hypothetical protein
VTCAKITSGEPSGAPAMASYIAIGALFRLVVLLQNEQAVTVFTSSILRANSVMLSGSSEGNRAVSAVVICRR